MSVSYGGICEGIPVLQPLLQAEKYFYLIFIVKHWINFIFKQVLLLKNIWKPLKWVVSTTPW